MATGSNESDSFSCSSSSTTTSDTNAASTSAIKKQRGEVSSFRMFALPCYKKNIAGWMPDKMAYIVFSVLHIADHLNLIRRAIHSLLTEHSLMPRKCI